MSSGVLTLKKIITVAFLCDEVIHTRIMFLRFSLYLNSQMSSLGDLQQYRIIPLLR